MSKTLCNRLAVLSITSLVATGSVLAQGSDRAPEGLLSAIAEKAGEKFCTAPLLLDQPPNLAFSLWSESTCEGCPVAQVLAESFSVDQATVVSEVVVWGWYFPTNTPPPFESWTVVFHHDEDGADPPRPAAVIASEMVVPVSRTATGRDAEVLGVAVDEQRWVLKLDRPVRLEDAGSYWIEVYHDSPIGSADTSIGYGDSDPIFGAAGAASSAAAPGEVWSPLVADLALQVCGFDARWDGLLVPGFEIDGANPADTTLVAVRNTSGDPLGIDISYFGENVDNGPFRIQRVELGPEQTYTGNIGHNLADLAGSGVIGGFIVVSEEGGGSANIEGDFSRVDFANDFAAGERMLRPGDFCKVQEVRVIDFGSGSKFNIVMRDPDPSEVAFSVSSLDEAGNAVAIRNFFTGANVLELPIDQLAGELSFGTLIFDFSGSGGGAVTGRYSAFGRFSTELAGACRD